MADTATTMGDSLPGTVPASAHDAATPLSTHSAPGAPFLVPGAVEEYDDALGEVVEDDAIFSADGGGQQAGAIRPRLRRRSSAPLPHQPTVASAPPASAGASVPVPAPTLRMAALQTHDEAYANGQVQSFVYSPTAAGVSALRGRSPTSQGAFSFPPTNPADAHPPHHPYALPPPQFPSRSVNNANNSNTVPLAASHMNGFGASSGSFQARRSVSFLAANRVDDEEDDETAIIDDEIEQDEAEAQRRRQLLRASSFRSADSDRESDASSATSFRAMERYRLRREDTAARNHMAELQRALGGGRVAAGSFAVPGGFVLRQSAPAHLVAPNRRDSNGASVMQHSYSGASSSSGMPQQPAPPAPAAAAGLPSSVYVTPPTPQTTFARPPAIITEQLDTSGTLNRSSDDAVGERSTHHRSTRGSGGVVSPDDSSSDGADARGSRAGHDGTSSSSPDTCIVRLTPKSATPKTQLSDVPTEILRFAVDHFLSISQHFNLRLVCRRWNAMVVSNCVLWMRRVPNYLTHGYTSTTNCSVFVNAGISVTATFNRIASRSSFGNLTLASSTLSEDTAILSRQQSWSSEANAARFARPQSIHYCFNGCAYRTWRALRLQKALSAIRRFHKQKNKYYGGAAACGVLFPPAAGFGTLLNSVVMGCVFIAWSAMWSDLVPTMQDPTYITYSYIALWASLFFMLCTLYMWSSSTEVIRRAALVAFALGVCATSVMEFLLDVYSLPSQTSLQVRVDPGTVAATATPTPSNMTTPTPFYGIGTLSPSSSSTSLSWSAAGSYAASTLLDLTARQGVSMSSKAYSDVPSRQVLYLLPMLLSAVALVAVSGYFAFIDTRITGRALELFEILDRYCEGVVPVRRLARRFRDGQPLVVVQPDEAAAGPPGVAPAMPPRALVPPAPHAVVPMLPAAAGQAQGPPTGPVTPTNRNRNRPANRTTAEADGAANEADAANGGDGGDSDDGHDGAPRGSMGNADGVTAISADTATRAAVQEARSYSVNQFAAFNISYTITGAVFCTALLFFTLELAGVAGYYTHHWVVFSDVGALVANGRVSGSGALYTTIPDPLHNASTSIVTLLGQSAASSPSLSRLSCTAHSGFRLSFFLVAIGMVMLLARHAIGMISSWRKVGRRLPPFTTTMVLIGCAMFFFFIAALTFAFSRVDRADASLSDAAKVSRFLTTTVFSAGPASGSTSAPSTSTDPSTQPTSFDPALVRISCRGPTVFTVAEFAVIVLAVFTTICSLVANLAHDKARYYEFKMVKYRRYFERLCAGEDLTTLGIERLLDAIRRFNESIGAIPAPGAAASALSTAATANSSNMLRGGPGNATPPGGR